MIYIKLLKFNSFENIDQEIIKIQSNRFPHDVYLILASCSSCSIKYGVFIKWQAHANIFTINMARCSQFILIFVSWNMPCDLVFLTGKSDSGNFPLICFVFLPI